MQTLEPKIIPFPVQDTKNFKRVHMAMILEVLGDIMHGDCKCCMHIKDPSVPQCRRCKDGSSWEHNIAFWDGESNA